MNPRHAAHAFVLALTLALVAAPAARATSVAPPVASVSFAPDVTAAGTPVSLGITVTNVDVMSALTGVSVGVTLPAGLVVATPSQLATTCDGTVVAVSGSAQVALTAATLQPAGTGDSCVVDVDVVAATPGLYAVATDTPTSDQSEPGSPSPAANLRVLGVVTTASPGIVLGSGTLSDSAQVLGPVAPQVTANVTFSLFGPDDAACANPAVFSSTVLFPELPEPVTSAAFAPAAAGTYRWRASFSEDGVNAVVTTACNDPGESSVVTAVAPPPVLPVPPGLPAPPPPPPPLPAAPTGPTCAGRPATIVVKPGRGRVNGTSGDDVIVGSARGETIDGRGGDDTICAGDGNDRVRGSGGDDLLLGEGGNDDIRGGTGADRLGGGDGPDRVDGGSGDDVLDEQNLGGGGHDRLFGGSGRDIVRTSGGTKDRVNCGTGDDEATLDRFDRQVHCEGRIILPPPLVLPPAR
jgi:hypothetical protein